LKKLKMPSADTILLCLILVVAGLTWIMPAGQYLYSASGEPLTGTYQAVARNGQTIWEILRAPLDGFYEAIEIAVFILMVGGFLGVLGKTGAIDGGIGAVVGKLGDRGAVLIPVLMVTFSLGGTTFGMAEETMAFYPLLLPVLVAAGYDTVTAVSVILLGAGAGVLGSTVNPFATGIASGFAGVSMGENIGLRLLILVLSLGGAIGYVILYGQRVLKDPSRSLVAAQRQENLRHFAPQGDETPTLSGRQKLALWLFAGTFGVMVYGVIPFADMGITGIPTLGWWFPELSVLFFAGAILTGILCRVGEGEIVEGFVSGAADLLGVAFIIGISRGITVLMNRGMITDTILYWGEKALTGAGGVGFILLAFVIFLVLSFLIPSSSGLATLAMPIMAPLAEMTGVSRALLVTAYQSASGLVNLITPTSAVVMGALAMGRVSYGVWLRFVWKLLVLLLLVCVLCLTLGAIMGTV
jgi:uncharacterized ion transporter superfamily protein YfcC